MAYASTTDPYRANPFGSTLDDPRMLQARVGAVMARARKRRAAIPEPGSYWEEPGFHGSGRQVDLRGARGRLADFIDNEVTGRYQRRARRLPPTPRKHFDVSHAVLLGAAVVTVGAVAWLLYDRHKRKMATTHMGDGYELLLEDA